MHEPYEARRFEREEKKGSVHYGWRSLVRALNENRTRGLPFRRRTLYPLSYKGDGTFRSFNDVRLCRAVFGMVLIDVAPETIAAKRASSPSVLNDRWRGIGRLDWVLPATSRTNEIMSDPLWTCRRFGRKPPCRARLILSSRFRCDCSITP